MEGSGGPQLGRLSAVAEGQFKLCRSSSQSPSTLSHVPRGWECQAPEIHGPCGSKETPSQLKLTLLRSHSLASCPDSHPPRRRRRRRQSPMSSSCYLETEEYAAAVALSRTLAGHPSRNPSQSLLPAELALFPKSFHALNDAFAQQLFRSASREQLMLDSIMGRRQRTPTVELPNLIVNDFMRHYCALAVAFHDLASHHMSPPSAALAVETTETLQPPQLKARASMHDDDKASTVVGKTKNSTDKENFHLLAHKSTPVMSVPAQRKAQRKWDVQDEELKQGTPVKGASQTTASTPASTTKKKTPLSSSSSSSTKKRQRTVALEVEEPEDDDSFEKEFLTSSSSKPVKSEETTLTEEYGSKLQVVFYHPSDSDRDFIWPGLLIPAKDRDPSMPKCAPSVRLVRFFQDFTYMILDDPSDEENLDLFDPKALEDYRQKVEHLSTGGGKGYKLSHQKCLEFMDTWKAPNDLKWAKWKEFEKKKGQSLTSGKRPRRT